MRRPEEEMKQEYQDYITLLRSFVQEEEPELSQEINWPEIIKCANINSTMGIVGYILMLYKDLADPDLNNFGRQRCMHEIALYSRRAEQMNQLICQLNAHQIDHLLFKGFIVRDYYTSCPELRTFGDIDFVIRKEDRRKCDELMKALGYEPHEDWEPVYSYTKGTEYYEIHTDVMEVDVSDKADYREYYSHIWEHVIKRFPESASYSYEFTPEFHFLYLLTHIAKHISVSGAGIRMYLDIAFFIKHFENTIDWAWIKEQLKILKFEDFANITFNAVERWFGVSSPVPIRRLSDEIMDAFTVFTLEGGVFGKVGRDRSVVFLKQQDRNEEKVSRFKTLMFHIFPPISSLENRYTYLQKHHWLLPFAWVHRLIGNHDSWGRYADHAKGIMNADTEEVLRLKKMYKEIGL